MARAITDRERYRSPFQTKPSGTTSTKCVTPFHSRTNRVPADSSPVASSLSTASPAANRARRRATWSGRLPNVRSCLAYATARASSRWLMPLGGGRPMHSRHAVTRSSRESMVGLLISAVIARRSGSGSSCLRRPGRSQRLFGAAGSRLPLRYAPASLSPLIAH